MAPVRILFVDDDSALTGLYRLLLAQLGDFVVAEEDEGTRALETARRFHPDMIFLDCNLPDKTGSEIAVELRADAELKTVPLAYLTGALTREEAATGQLGGLPALAKPFRSEEFIRLVSACTAWRFRPK
jgi:DNA-binding response OmpR family regulator